MDFTIKQCFDEREKSAVVVKIMRQLPDWFYQEETILKYQEEVKTLPFFIAYNEQLEAVGMISLIVFEEPEIASIEIKVIGVLSAYHHRGLGLALIRAAEDFARKQGKKHLVLKTLSSRSPDLFYQKTRQFYKRCGFIELMDLVELWDLDNPCLLMLKFLD